MESWADVEMYSCGGVSPGPGWAKAWAEPAGHWLSGEAASRQSWGAPPGQAKALGLHQWDRVIRGSLALDLCPGTQAVNTWMALPASEHWPRGRVVLRRGPGQTPTLG